MSDDNVQLIQGAYEAFGRGDIPAVLAILDENIVWHTPEVLPQHASVNGRDDVLGFFQKLGSIWQDFNLEIRDFCASDDHVCVIGRASGKRDGAGQRRHPPAGPSAIGGACVHFDEYVDPSSKMVADAAG